MILSKYYQDNNTFLSELYQNQILTIACFSRAICNLNCEMKKMIKLQGETQKFNQ